MVLASNRSQLYVGTSTGSLRVYNWPPSGYDSSRPGVATTTTGLSLTNNNIVELTAEYTDLYAHGGAVVYVETNSLGNMLISAAADGSVYVHSIEGSTIDPMLDVGDDNNSALLDTEVILMALEDVEESVNVMLNLEKELKDLKSENDFQAHNSEVEHAENIRKLTDFSITELNREKETHNKKYASQEVRLRELDRMLGILTIYTKKKMWKILLSLLLSLISRR